MKGIVTCCDAKDFATREILESILKDEDRHIDVSKRYRTRSRRWACRFSCQRRTK